MAGPVIYELPPKVRRSIRSIVMVSTPDIWGTGFLVGPCRVMTAEHVISRYDEAQVHLVRLDDANGRLVPYGPAYAAKIDRRNSQIDAAELKMRRSPRKPWLRWANSDNAYSGSPFWRFGLDVGWTCGYCFDCPRKSPVCYDLHIGMPLDPGGSGGPILDENGRVSGIAVRTSPHMHLPPTCKAVPSNIIRQVLLKETPRAIRISTL